MSEPALLSVEDVAVDLPTPRGNLRAVDQVDLIVGAGQTLGIVGESGCGKTMLSRADPAAAAEEGETLRPGDVRRAGSRARSIPNALRKLRGRELAVVFQDPMTSLNPVLTIGTQIDRDAAGASRTRRPCREDSAAWNCWPRSAFPSRSSG